MRYYSCSRGGDRRNYVNKDIKYVEIDTFSTVMYIYIFVLYVVYDRLYVQTFELDTEECVCDILT